MARVLGPDAYDRWMRGLLPQVFYKMGENLGMAKDSTAGERSAGGVAWTAGEKPAPEAGTLDTKAAAAYWEHRGLEGLVLDGYLADHWVGSFVVAAIEGGCRPGELAPARG